MQVRSRLRVIVALLIASSALSMSSANGAVSVASTPVGTVTIAEAANSSPNYIFPFMNCAYFSTNNINRFQQLMFRPLYWFGVGASSAFAPNISLAAPPKFSKNNKSVTISMKGWKFADGQIVNARSVMFFLNMYKADPTSYCGYTVNAGIPDQVRMASGKGNIITINFSTAINPQWILSNYLSEITPMPDAWDKTASSTIGHCATGAFGATSTKLACLDVEHFLDTQATNTESFAGSLWQSGIDGPWKLTNFDNSGDVTFQANERYSGPQKPMVRFVREVAFTSVAAEENQLQAGSLDIGYVDPSILPSPASRSGAVGANWGQLSSRYRLFAGSTWSFNYAAINFSQSEPKAAALDKLYVRQALQTAIDQRGVIMRAYGGYAFPSYGPLPPSTPTAISGHISNPYPFNLSTAKNLLTSHGWSIQNGVMTCTVPGIGASQCGAGIGAGFTLNFAMVWATASPTLDQVFLKEVADWASIGIIVTHSTDIVDKVIADCSGASGFDICSWGDGWLYQPAYFPSGERLFTPTGDFNVGSFTDPHMTSIIEATLSGTGNLSKYANYAAHQLPVLFEPKSATVVEVIRTLKSRVAFTPSPVGNFMPEYLHY